MAYKNLQMDKEKHIVNLSLEASEDDKPSLRIQTKEGEIVLTHSEVKQLYSDYKQLIKILDLLDEAL